MNSLLVKYIYILLSVSLIVENCKGQVDCEGSISSIIQFQKKSQPSLYIEPEVVIDKMSHYIRSFQEYENFSDICEGDVTLMRLIL